jgi:hypothetical protein
MKPRMKRVKRRSRGSRKPIRIELRSGSWKWERRIQIGKL